MLLYEHPLSSYAQKVKIALREKGQAFEPPMPEGIGQILSKQDIRNLVEYLSGLK